MSEQDPAALVARARKLADWLRKMGDVSDDADLLNSLASALEAALAREGRMNEALVYWSELVGYATLNPDADDLRAAILTTARDARAALAPDADKEPTP